jgi:hypothetical protein
MPRAKSVSRPVTRLHNYSAMLLEDLDAYHSDTGSSIQSAIRRQCPKLSKMVLIPMRLKRNPKANPVKSKYSTGNLMNRTSTRQLKNRSGAAVRRPVRQTIMLLGHQSWKASCQNMMSFTPILRVKSLQSRLQAPSPSMGACFIMEQGSFCASGL